MSVRYTPYAWLVAAPSEQRRRRKHRGDRPDDAYAFAYLSHSPSHADSRRKIFFNFVKKFRFHIIITHCKSQYVFQKKIKNFVASERKTAPRLSARDCSSACILLRLFIGFYCALIPRESNNEASVSSKTAVEPSIFSHAASTSSWTLSFASSLVVVPPCSFIMRSIIFANGFV